MQHEDTGYITSKIFELEELESYDGFQEPHRYFTFKRCQFTGLFDKQGVEIYEGDILAGVNGSVNGRDWKWGNYEVKYKNGNHNAPIDWGNFENFDSTHWFEVVGNIYENPELLEGKNETIN